MFTGIIEAVGSCRFYEPAQGGARIGIACPDIVEGVSPGDSISVNGCCLTVTAVSEGMVVFDAIPETIGRTNLKSLKIGEKVNLERALTVGGRVGGHFVAGHVDGVVVIKSKVYRGNSWEMSFSLERWFARYITFKGSVALDGISLTVKQVLDNSFSVGVIPYTMENTNLVTKRVGDPLNLEVDLLARYMERLMSVSDRIPDPGKLNTVRANGEGGLSLELLERSGFG